MNLYKITNGATSISKILEAQLDQYFSECDVDKLPSNLYDYVIHEVEQVLISKTLNFTNGNQTKAAKILGINRNTLKGKIKNRN